MLYQKKLGWLEFNATVAKVWQLLQSRLEKYKLHMSTNDLTDPNYFYYIKFLTLQSLMTHSLHE